MALHALFLVLSFATIGCKAEALKCDIRCLDERQFTLNGLTLRCPGKTICNENCIEVNGKQPTCAPVNELCPYECSNSNIILGTGTNKVSTTCPENTKCNDALDSCKKMCIPVKCPNADHYECLNETTYNIYGLYGTCEVGKICNQKKMQPCDICLEDNASVIKTTTSKPAETTTTKPKELTTLVDATMPKETTKSKEITEEQPEGTTNSAKTNNCDLTGFVKTTVETVTPRATTKDTDSINSGGMTKPAENTEQPTKPGDTTGETTTPDEFIKPEGTTQTQRTTIATTTKTTTHPTAVNCNFPSGKVSPCRYGPTGYYYKCIRSYVHHIYIPKLVSCYNWISDPICNRYRLC